jgi:hypothetical protein
MNSNADISIANSTLTGNTSSSNSYPNVDMTAAHVVSVVNSTITTSYLSMNAGVALNVDTVNINSATGVNMSARTINLSNINFPGGSQVYLNSQNGVLAPMPNTNAASVVGDVNFIKNVNYNHTPAQNFVPTSVGGTSTSGNEPIHINTLVR